MHLGNAFSALLAWAFARSENGEFVVRLENLDERCQNPAYVKGVLDDLRWLGIEWDGEPFVQTERVAAYEVALGHIADKAELYPCFCSRADLHAASAPHASDGHAPVCGTCFSMDPDERDALAPPSADTRCAYTFPTRRYRSSTRSRGRMRRISRASAGISCCVAAMACSPTSSSASSMISPRA